MTTNPAAARDKIANLMEEFRSGNREAGADLTELFYPELKRLASRQLRNERIDHSWQPTLLVNEFYLELARIRALPAAQSDQDNHKAAFLALAGQIMRRLLIHHARPLSSQSKKVALHEQLRIEDSSTALEVEDVLRRLGAIKPAVRTVVELKVFEGLTAEEIAPRIGCAVVTVNRYWQFARHWLQKEWLDTEAAGAGSAG